MTLANVKHEPARLKHRHGGDIVKVVAVGHETHGGVAEWYFIGEVQWSDGTTSKDTQIAPFCLGHDSTPEGQALCNEMHGALAQYLGDVGEWHDQKRARDGRHYSWTPREKSGRRAIGGV